MIGAIIIGGAILIGSVVLFGPLGLIVAVFGALLVGSIQNGSWTTISEKDKAHARAVDEALGIKRKEPVAEPHVEEWLRGAQRAAESRKK